MVTISFLRVTDIYTNLIFNGLPLAVHQTFDKYIGK